MTNKLAIFRVPPDEDGDRFVQIVIDADGKIEQEGTLFYIDNPEDTYLQLGFNQLVIADQIEGGSTNARSVTIADPNDDTVEVKTYEFSFEELQAAVSFLLPQLAAEVQ